MKVCFIVVALAALCTAQQSSWSGFFRSLSPLLLQISDFLDQPNKDTTGFKVLLDAAYELAGDRVSGSSAAIPKPSTIPWWGAGEGTTADESIRPFSVDFGNSVNEIRSRLNIRRNITSPIVAANNTYGINSAYLDSVLEYWANGYDFNAREKYLNRHPQFVTNVQGLDIHYVHIKPTTSKKVLPILLLHGVPLNLFEFHYVIDYLKESRGDADFDFEIIVPDLPGFGYSEETYKKGLNGYQIAIIMKNLMSRLGHEKFYVHAGDVGNFVGQALSVVYPEDVLGYHSNLAFSFMPKTLITYVMGAFYPTAVVEARYESRMYPISSIFSFAMQNLGYMHMQATRPENFGVGADASPEGLVAWILPLMMSGGAGREKNYDFYDGNISQNYNLDDILDSLTIYWDAQCMTTSARFYYEQFMGVDEAASAVTSAVITVPFATIKFPDEIIYQPDSFLQDKYPNLLQSTYAESGGHFAGFERPRELSESIWSSVSKMETVNAEKARNLLNVVN